MYFAPAMFLFRGRGYEEFVRLLAHGLDRGAGGRGTRRVAPTAAIGRVRRRLGPEPLRAVFARVRRPVATKEAAGAWYRACGWSPSTAPPSTCPTRRRTRSEGTVVDSAVRAALVGAVWPPGERGSARRRVSSVAALGAEAQRRLFYVLLHFWLVPPLQVQISRRVLSAVPWPVTSRHFPEPVLTTVPSVRRLHCWAPVPLQS